MLLCLREKERWHRDALQSYINKLHFFKLAKSVWWVVCHATLLLFYLS